MRYGGLSYGGTRKNVEIDETRISLIKITEHSYCFIRKTVLRPTGAHNAKRTQVPERIEPQRLRSLLEQEKGQTTRISWLTCKY